MVYSDTIYIDMDAFNLNEVTEYIKKDYPQLLYLKYRKDVKYLDVVSTEKIPDMYNLYQQLIKFQEITWEKYISKAWDDLRNERNRRLQESDWTQLDDVKKTIPQEVANIWIVYRQYLRDMPKNTTDPFNPIWPTMPKPS